MHSDGKCSGDCGKQAGLYFGLALLSDYPQLSFGLVARQLVLRCLVSRIRYRLGKVSAFNAPQDLHVYVVDVEVLNND